MALEVGSRLGHYSVTALIGEGGMGAVYQARDTKLDRDAGISSATDQSATRNEMVVVLDWVEELKERVPVP